MKKLILKSPVRRVGALALAAVALAVVTAPQASAYAFVEVDEGALSFTPSVLVAPIITAAVAAVIAAAVLFVLAIGVRAVKRFVTK